jgi:hypothetical protein
MTITWYLETQTHLERCSNTLMKGNSTYLNTNNLDANTPNKIFMPKEEG